MILKSLAAASPETNAMATPARHDVKPVDLADRGDDSTMLLGVACTVFTFRYDVSVPFANDGDGSAYLESHATQKRWPIHRRLQQTKSQSCQPDTASVE